jgi:hypothetical protein
MKRSAAPYMACGGLVGALIALVALPPKFITGTGAIWIRPKYDLNTYLATWHYFVQDHWRFPILDVPAMGYPEGGSVLFTDALPIAQLASKAIHSATGQAVNPLGWWIFLTYVLQGALAARVVRAAGVRSLLASITAAILAIACFPFMGRLWHVAASSHFLILWALALYFENVRDRRFSAFEHFALSALALLVNAYLFVMVGVLQVVTFATLWKGDVVARRDWTVAALSLCGVAAVGLVEGYGHIFTGSGSMRAAGFGSFSWNLITLVVPDVRFWGYPRGTIRYVTPAQAEGEAYLGLGSILVLITCLVTRPKQAALAVRRHWLLASAFLAFAAYAASDRVYLGSQLLLHLPLPDVVVEMASFFRASGRFIWVPVYALSLLSLAALFKWTPRRLAIPVALVAMLLQVLEGRTAITFFRPALVTPDSRRIQTPQLGSWMKGHRRLFQFPSWSCGGLTNEGRTRTVETEFMEMQIELLAARLDVPTNSVYTSRQLKDCQAEARWAAQPDLEDDVLYLLNRADVTRTIPLAALASSPACVDVGWALVCSRSTLQ